MIQAASYCIDILHYLTKYRISMATVSQTTSHLLYAVIDSHTVGGMMPTV